MGNWKLIKPTATTNLCTNPSFETNTTGWAASGTNTIARSSTQSWVGNYSLLCTYQNDTSLAGFTITLPTASTTYKIHSRLFVSTNWDGGDIEWLGVNFTSSTDTTVHKYTDGTSATGEWIYIETTFLADSDVAGDFELTTTSAPTAGRTVYLDAVQIEELSTPTTYYDGSLPGGYWTGAEHGSTSVREVSSRAGGTYKDFEDDYSVYIGNYAGVGLPPVANMTVDRALLPGTEHQRAKVGERIFTFVHRMIGSSISNLHALRQSLIAVISPDAVPDDQPVILEYQGATVPKRIDAHYAGGLEFSGPDGFTEQIGLQFIATEPFFYGLGEEKVNLAPTSATVRLVAARQRGTWTELGPPSATTASYLGCQDILIENDKSVYVCGEFTDFDDIVAADYIVKWNGSTWSAVGTPLDGSASITSIADMTRSPAGTLYVGGTFTDLANVAAADYIASWNGSAWAAVGTPTTGAASFTAVFAVQYGHDGNLYIGGNFANMGDVANADNIGYWDGSAYNAMSTGTNSYVSAIAAHSSGRMYVGGNFTTAGPTTVNYIAEWDNGGWASLNDGFNDEVNAIVIDTDGTIYAGGDFTQSNGGDTLNRIAKWNGTAWEPLGTGLNNSVYSMSIDSDGLLWVGGAFTQAGSLTTADRLAIWDGASWRHAPIDLPGTPSVRALTTANNDDIWVGFDATGTAYFSNPTASTNSGTARAYPIITIKRSGGSGTLTLEEIVNITTGRRLLFNLDLLDGEEIIIDLRPGRRSMTTNFAGGFETANRLQSWRLLPGSDITDFYLLPGANSLAVYTSPAAPSALDVFVRWQAAYWSLD